MLIVAFSKSSPTELGGVASDFTNNSTNQTSASTSSVTTEKSYSYYDNSTDDKNDETDVAVSYPLNINTCTMEELMTIDGIGESKADAIIQYREYLGGYTSVEQIKNIKGFGDATYEKLSPYLTV